MNTLNTVSVRTLNVGIIGYGYWGPNLTRNFFDIPASELIAIADTKDDRLQRAKSIYPEIVTTNNYADLFEMNLDAVVVSTPPATHYPIAKDCLEHGLHVLVEKPMTLNSQHAQELIDLANDRGLILMVGHVFEYNSAVNALKEYIDSGVLGEIYYIDSARLNLGLFQNDNVLWDLAPHDISIFLYLLGEKPVSVSAHGMACVFEGIYDVVHMNLTFPNRLPAYIHVSWLDPCKVRRVTVVGSQKMIVYNDLANEQMIKIYDKGVEIPAYTNGGFDEFQCNYRSGDIVIPKIQVSEPLRKECQHFLDCIVNNEQPRSSGDDGLSVIKILEAAHRSMANGSTHEVIQW